MSKRMDCLAVVAMLARAAVAQEPAPSRVDLHVHVTMDRAAKPLFQGEPGRGALATSTWSFLENQVDARSLRAAGIRIVGAALWPPFALRPGRTALDEAVDQLRKLDAFAEENPEFAVARSGEELRRALASDRIALFPLVEGGEGIERVEDVDLLYAAGARAIGLVHFTDNRLCGAMPLPSPRVIGFEPDPARWTGLTPLGKAAVARMIELGILVDLAHASEPSAAAVADIADARGVPLVLSHVGSWGVNPLEVNVSDELAARVARGGGLIGVLAQRTWAGQVGAAYRWPGFVPGSCDDAIAHWLHLARVAGAESLVLGSDMNGFAPRPPAGGSCPSGLRNAGDLPDLFAALERKGVPRAALDSSAERFIQLVDRAQSRADPAAQRSASRRKPEVPDLFAAPPL